MDGSLVFLWAVLALSLYGIGLIWSVQLVIFPSWRMLSDANQLYYIRRDYWKKLPFFVFIPIGILFLLTIVLLLDHPLSTPIALLWIALAAQVLIDGLTGLTWARWERQIAQEHLPPSHPLLARLVYTHWIRTALITINGAAILWAAIATFS